MRSFCVAIPAIAILASAASALAPPDAWSYAERTKLTAGDAGYLDSLGTSVAVFGDTAVVGAYLDDDLGIDTGAAYVFVGSEDSWTEQAKLKASDAAPYDYFGSAAAIDGDTAVIGAYHQSGAGTFSGAAYVFVRTGTTWTEEAKLVPNDPAAHDWFGWSVAVSGDVAFVSSPYDDDGFVPDVGSVYVFTRTGTTWTEKAKLRATDSAAGAFFGYGLAVEGDTALIGAHGDDAGGNNAGAAYIFATDGTSWTQNTKLGAGNSPVTSQFGWSVDLSGGTALIGAPTDDPGPLTNSGSAYVFVTDGTSWTEEAKILPAAGQTNELFGSSVSLSGDRALVAAPGTGAVGTDPGAAYFFARNGTSWAEVVKVSGADTELGDGFGHKVSLDGDVALFGAPRDGHSGIVRAGSAYIFTSDLGASATFRNVAPNLASYTVTSMPRLGGTFVATVDLTGSGHDGAILAGFQSPLTFNMGFGYKGLINVADPAGEKLGVPYALGPMATFSINIPTDPALAGYRLYTQSAHVGGVMPYALSNAQDLVLGYSGPTIPPLAAEPIMTKKARRFPAGFLRGGEAREGQEDGGSPSRSLTRRRTRSSLRRGR